MVTVVKWSGIEARALRLARRMSVREFARHLGFNDAAVSNWESRGSDARLRHHTQEVLDTDLARAPEDVRQRFAQALDSGYNEAGGLARGSSDRTVALLDAMQAQGDADLPYRSPHDATDSVWAFIRAPSRVHMITGPAGSGKTRLTYHLADVLSADVDFQLHSATSWVLQDLDLAVEVLRYASIAGGTDPLLTLESEAVKLARPCLIIIDGITAQEQFDQIARHIDIILRQVRSEFLRFVLVVRTPPLVQTSAHPVLNASIFNRPGSQQFSEPYLIPQWTTADARATWDSAKPASTANFDALPHAVQQLTRLPLYLRLLLAAGPAAANADANPYALVDHCVRSVVRGTGRDVERTLDALADLAQRDAPTVIPTVVVSSITPQPSGDQDLRTHSGDLAAIIRTQIAGNSPEFVHDILREYFLATRLAQLLTSHGRSVATVSALNDLAEQAATSAIARNVFEFVIHHLDSTARDVVTAAALAPTISLSTTLPLMLGFSDSDTGFATSEVLRACAQRCDQGSAQELITALLATPAVLPALGDAYHGWLVAALRRFGTAIWDSAARFIEQNLDARKVQELLAAADLDHGDEAIFVARHFFLFFGDNTDEASTLTSLLNHQNWRVRAALAQGLRDSRAPTTQASDLVIGTVVDDNDYKVRAAAALALTHMPASAANAHLPALLLDRNWHVRERVLQGLLSNAQRTTEGAACVRDLAQTALSLVSTEPSWQRCPAHVRPGLHRLRLLYGAQSDDREPVDAHALFGVLREIRTGWLTPPDADQTHIVAEGRRSDDWLVQREADALAATAAQPLRFSSQEEFRRLRSRRSVQIALDSHNLEESAAVAREAAAAGADFIEVGDPLIKAAGLSAITYIKRHVPNTAVIAEMMSADWGRDQVVLAAQAGADVVLLIGPATVASVSAAVEAGRRLGVPILLDTPLPLLSRQWITDMERAGVDGFTVTTNIDIGIGSRHALTSAHTIRTWTRLPVAVSGGFGPTDYDIIADPDWDILIVGRSVSDALDPGDVVRHITNLVRDTTPGAP